MDSILTSVKKMLGIDASYEHFDIDIIMHINTVISILTQLGVGPNSGYTITGTEDTWVDWVGESTSLSSVKSFVYLKVRLLFDPPTNSSLIDSYNRLISELEWRLKIGSEGIENEQNG